MGPNKDMDLEQYVDQRRWLLNNGLITDDVKNQLYFSGSIVHREVQAVELDVELGKKLVQYKIYVDTNLIKKIDRYNTLSKSTSLLDLWRFKRFLKKEGALDFHQILNKYVKDFCGSTWNVTVEIVDFNIYVEGFGDQSETDRAGQLFNK